MVVTKIVRKGSKNMRVQLADGSTALTYLDTAENVVGKEFIPVQEAVKIVEPFSVKCMVTRGEEKDSAYFTFRPNEDKTFGFTCMLLIGEEIASGLITKSRKIKTLVDFMFLIRNTQTVKFETIINSILDTGSEIVYKVKNF